MPTWQIDRGVAEEPMLLEVPEADVDLGAGRTLQLSGQPVRQ